MEKTDLNSYTNGEMTAAVAEQILWKKINIIFTGNRGNPLLPGLKTKGSGGKA